MIAAAFHTRTDHVRHAIDWLGAALLAGGLSAVVLFTSLGGTTYAWGSAEIAGLIAAAAVLLPLFVLAEHRAAEPIMPLSLFRNRIFAASSAIGFVVGLALFGAITYMPVFLQIVKGESPTGSGLQLTPMMAGVLVTSIVSGQLISRFGRYKPFPIAGTAVMTIGLVLLSRLGVGTSTWTASAYMLVLGLGLGMVMQVLVLAVQNARRAPVHGRRHVAARSSSARSAARSASRSSGRSSPTGCTTTWPQRLPAGARVPSTADPASIRHLPGPVHDAYVSAFAVSLRPVFLVAAAIGVAAFLLTWLLREVPLRKGVGAAETETEPRALPTAAPDIARAGTSRR